MTRRGRKPDLLGVLDRLEGSECAKQRLRQVLRHAIEGRTAQESADSMGLSTSRFHELQYEALQGALEALEPKSPGRPRCVSSVPEEVARELERARREIDWLTWRTEVAQVREATSLIFGGDLKKSPRPRNTNTGAKGTAPDGKEHAAPANKRPGP